MRLSLEHTSVEALMIADCPDDPAGGSRRSPSWGTVHLNALHYEKFESE